LFYVTDKDNITYRGNVYSPANLDTALSTSLDIEKTLRTINYIIISGKDEARIEARNIKEYGIER